MKITETLEKLKQQRQRGEISDNEYDAALRQMVRQVSNQVGAHRGATQTSRHDGASAS